MADGDYVFDPKRFRGLAVPTLLLLGERSPAILRRPIEALASVLPHSRVAVLPGQGHVAMSTAPNLFVREVEDPVHAALLLCARPVHPRSPSLD